MRRVLGRRIIVLVLSPALLLAASCAPVRSTRAPQVDASVVLTDRALRRPPGPNVRQETSVPVPEMSAQPEMSVQAETSAQPEPSVLPEMNAPESSIPAPSALTSAPAVVALLSKADELEQAGQADQAAAVLERALRIEPRNARLWHRLAEIHLAQGLWQGAANVAAKSNALAGDDIELQVQNWDVIAEAQGRQGNAAAARDARERAIELRAKSR